MPFQYSTIKGYFLQDEITTDDKKFDFDSLKFGLIRIISGTPFPSGILVKSSQWDHVMKEVDELNKEASKVHAQVKVLFLARHGQGHHNVAEMEYGIEAWEAHYAKLTGNEHSTWSDAKLTALGKEQALKVHALWKTGISEHGMPSPQSYYSSPLSRCLETVSLTFTGLPLSADRPFRVTIKENLRETTGRHTCDKRSKKSEIEAQVSKDVFTFEDGFTEEDVLWNVEQRETDQEIDARLKGLLDDIFENDAASQCISITCHFGVIRAILRVIGHREFFLGPGDVIPVMVRADRT